MTKDFIMVKMRTDDLYNLFYDRLQRWRNKDSKDFKLFMKYYERCIDDGIFENMELDIMQIVDNDVVNWCDIIESDDEDFAKLLELYKEQGLGDVSCEEFPNRGKIGFIEEVDDEDEPTAFLIRAY
jgi:hypothetical protein